ncbi:MAG: hypothetical protein O3A70_07580 [Bacteroidetes bacterium]|nr:hypothetical protein [Bacteroidota bacterium]
MDRIHFALALSLTPGIGPVRAREILQAYPEPEAWAQHHGMESLCARGQPPHGKA